MYLILMQLEEKKKKSLLVMRILQNYYLNNLAI